MPGRMEFTLGVGRAPARRAERAPMRMLILGDFSGAPAPERPPLAERATPAVDVDAMDAVLSRLAPRVGIADGAYTIDALDDFHPDALIARVPSLAALRAARDAPPPAPGENPLAALLGASPVAAPTPAPSATPASGLDALLQRVVAPHVVPDRAAATDAWRSGVDAALSEALRAVLHDPVFQAREAAWRGVQWLVSNLELDASLRLHLLDVTRDELLADIVASQGRLAETALHRNLADRWRNTPDGVPWSALVSLERFGDDDVDVGLLAALGLIASQAGGPLIAGARAMPAGDGWQALRRSEAAPSIALAAPRLLLRRPYGRRSDPLTSFPFEEFGAGDAAHEALLWGAPALAPALVAARAYANAGWPLDLEADPEIDDLPAWTRPRGGETALQPCAERLIGEQEGQAMLAAGLMPLLSHRDRPAVRVARWQSIADPPQPLAGF